MNKKELEAENQFRKVMKIFGVILIILIISTLVIDISNNKFDFKSAPLFYSALGIVGLGILLRSIRTFLIEQE